MQQDLEHTASAVSKLEQENTLLKQRSVQQGAEPDVEAVDPVAAEQVGFSSTSDVAMIFQLFRHMVALLGRAVSESELTAATGLCIMPLHGIT